MTTKICTKCQQEKYITRFSKRSTAKDGYRSICKDCMNVQYTDRIKSDPSKLARKRQTGNISRKRNDYLIRKEVFDKFGHKCKICGEYRYEFLAIDHINNDGYIDRKSGSTAIQRKIKQQGFPTDKYQLLCHNCNAAKAFYGYNPILMENETRIQSEGLHGEGI